jgi:small subunit ribosomal protein S7
MKVYKYKNKNYFKQKFLTDPYFNTVLLTKFINFLTFNGNKSVLKKHFKNFIIDYKLEFNKHFIYFFIHILKKLNPFFILKSKKIAGKTFSFPVPLQRTSQYRYALKSFCNGLSEYTNISLKEKFKTEFLNVLVYDKGNIIKKHQTYLASVIENRAYSHFRWS